MRRWFSADEPRLPPGRPADPVGSPVDRPTSTDGDAEIAGALRAFLVETSEGRLQTGEIAPGENLFEAGYLDSLSSAALVAFVEERWGMTIADADLLGPLGTVSALAAHIRSRKS